MFDIQNKAFFISGSTIVWNTASTVTTESSFKADPKARLHDFADGFIGQHATSRCQHQRTQNL